MAKYRDKIKSKFCFVYTYGKISNSENVKLFFAKGDNQPCQGIRSKTVRNYSNQEMLRGILGVEIRNNCTKFAELQFASKI